MKLVDPSLQWRDAFLEMAREYEQAGDHRYAAALDDFAAYVRHTEARRDGVDLPAGRAPQAELWLEHAGDILGCARLRFALTRELEQEGGHIGYDVRPTARRRGTGTKLLALAIVRARAHGIQRIRVTCDDDNAGSIKIIEHNGGALAGKSISSHSGKLVRQYWINP